MDRRLPTSPTGMRFAHRSLGPLVLRRLGAQVTGLADVPRSGGVLFAANHRSFLDHYLLNAASPRAMWFLGKAELGQGVLGRFHKLMGMIPVERGTADLRVLEMVADILRAGEAVGIFPEGTRSITGELFRFRSGLSRLAASSGVPVIPVGLVGTAEVWPRGQRPSWRRPRPGLLQVHFGQPIPPVGLLPRDRRELTACVNDRVAALCGQPKADRFAPVAHPHE
ncbi:MAG: lysophospholipid acyltransferase family protein [Egibacteraceae bacterium]